MSENRRGGNPFFPLTAFFGASFAITTLATLVGSLLADPAAPLNKLLDQYAGILLVIEVVATLLSGLLALLVDRRQTLSQDATRQLSEMNDDLP